MKRKIVIAGGHLTPALAVIEELQKRGDWEIFYFGRPYSTEGDNTSSLESKIIKEQGVRFIPINFGRIQHNFTRYSLWAFLRIPWGFILSFIQLIRFRPNLVLSFGSYVGITVVISSWVLGIPVVIHEQTTIAGLANRIGSSLAKKILVSWPQTLKIFPQEKTILTGNPIRLDVFQFKSKIWESFKFDSKLPLVLITGGNQGSHRINVAVEGVLEKILGKYNLFHQTGHLESLGDFDRLSQVKEKLPADLKKRYQIRKYLTGGEWGTILRKADLVVSRAGINTISELSALGKPQLLIPIPWLPADEQGQNARMVKKRGLGEILAQKDLNPENLFQKIEDMMKNLKKYQQKPEQVNLQAAGKIVDELEKMA
jgi:UDP-N-acetylglucosamine--N-acetylmuramyl-(pentapeptide) pyrophosphoryl-undecaprenol N-acetylglucosamine transferase